MTRALLSATPPGANGTTMRTGLTGYSCAQAAAATARPAATHAARTIVHAMPNRQLFRSFVQL